MFWNICWNTSAGKNCWMSTLLCLMTAIMLLMPVTHLPLSVEAAKGRDKKIYKLYPYYWKSNTRFPYYDKYGRGKLLYGFGGPELYEYTAFKAIRGYYRK
ncbi:unnamed protein product [Notodromas monacha]|uniref:Uncharacterized protein n=1 Tax=Notodromas monacha TaxID=399045 RepID=A0A7R9GIA0_9CRUS|nr:unnamed protein product [Notodromas monacha]CAG0922216.1 unnamed protein product [Notodromas monacha]